MLNELRTLNVNEETEAQKGERVYLGCCRGHLVARWALVLLAGSVCNLEVALRKSQVSLPPNIQQTFPDFVTTAQLPVLRPGVLQQVPSWLFPNL